MEASPAITGSSTTLPVILGMETGRSSNKLMATANIFEDGQGLQTLCHTLPWACVLLSSSFLVIVHRLRRHYLQLLLHQRVLFGTPVRVCLYCINLKNLFGIICNELLQVALSVPLVLICRGGIFRTQGKSPFSLHPWFF